MARSRGVAPCSGEGRAALPVRHREMQQPPPPPGTTALPSALQASTWCRCADTEGVGLPASPARTRLSGEKSCRYEGACASCVTWPGCLRKPRDRRTLPAFARMSRETWLCLAEVRDPVFIKRGCYRRRAFVSCLRACIIHRFPFQNWRYHLCLDVKRLHLESCSVPEAQP